MSARKAGKATPEILQVPPPDARDGKLKALGGSMDDDFNHVLANQVLQALWPSQAGTKWRERQLQAAISGMLGIQGLAFRAMSDT